MAAGSIVIDLLMKTGSFETDTKRAEKALKEFEKTATQWGKAILGAATVATVALGYMVKQSIDAMDSMTKLAQSTGTTVEELSGLAYAAELAGTNQEQLGSSLVKLAKNMSEARQAAGDTRTAFEALGIGMASLETATVKETLLTIAEKFEGYADGVNKTALATALFGKAGAQLIPFLNQGASGISDLVKEAERLGVVFKEEDAKAAEVFNDTLTKLNTVVKGLTTQLAIELLPTFNAFLGKLTETTTEVDGLKDSIKDVIKTDFKDFVLGVGNGLAHLVDAAVAVAKAIRAIGGSFESVFEDVKVFAAATNLVMNAINPFRTGELITEFKDALESRNQVVADANQRYIDLWQKDATTFTTMWKQATAVANMPTIVDIFDPVAPASKPKGQAPAITGTQGKASEYDQEVKRLVETIALVGRQTEAEKNLEYVLLNKFGKLDASQKLNLSQLAETLDATKKSSEAFERYAKFIDEVTGRSEFDDFVEKMSFLSKALYEGSINADQYTKGVDALALKFKGATDQMSEFAVQAAHNIQNVLGDAMEQVLAGNFNNIGNLFTNMLNKMIAQLAASQLSAALFGNFGTTGQVGGLLGAAGSAIAGAFNGGFGTGNDFGNQDMGQYFSDGGYTGDGGKYDAAGVVHKGEYVFDAASTRKIGVGALNRMRGYADGGYVGAGSPLPDMSAPSVTINLVNQSKQTLQADQGQPRFDGQKFVQDIILSDLKRNGPIGQAIRG